MTVSYKGKVDETHEILVFLFDHAAPNAESIPRAMMPVHTSGGTATFKNVSADTVYVVVVLVRRGQTLGDSESSQGWRRHRQGTRIVKVEKGWGG